MAFYRRRDDGLFELDTPGGAVPLPTTEEELRANGHVPDNLSMTGSRSGATAEFRMPGRADDQFRADAALPPPRMDPRELAARQGMAGGEHQGRLSPDLGPGSGYRGPESAGVAVAREQKELAEKKAKVSDAEADRLQAEFDRKNGGVIVLSPEESAKRKAEGEKGRFGEVVKDIKTEQPADREPSGGFGGGGVVRVGPAGFSPVSRTVRVGVEGLDDSIDKQNLLRQEQYRAERDAIPAQRERIERQSAELGRNIRAEEVALQKERERRERINRDLEERQGAIDAERQAVEQLQIRPRDLFHGKDTFTTALSAITMLAGAIGQAYKGGPNLAEQALDKAIDNEIADQKEARDRRMQGLRGKETELERLTNLYGSPELAEQEFRIRAHTLIQRKAEKDALDAGATDAVANLQARWAARNQEFEQQKLQMRAQLGDQVSQQERFSSGLVGTGRPKPKEQDVHQYGSDLEKAGIGESEGKLGAVQDLISGLPEGELPTVGTRNILSRGARSAIDTVAGSGSAAGLLDSEAERRSVAGVERIMGELRHELSGAAVNAQEQELLNRQLDQINTREGLQQFAGDLQRRIARRKAGIRAQNAPEAVQEYEGRKRVYDLPRRSGALRGE